MSKEIVECKCAFCLEEASNGRKIVRKRLGKNFKVSISPIGFPGHLMNFCGCSVEELVRIVQKLYNVFPPGEEFPTYE